MRALVSCLALLHYYQVTALRPEQWANLRNVNFQDITFKAMNAATLSEKIRYASNRYLIQYTSLSLSFIKNGDSKLPLVVGPIAKILFRRSLIGEFCI